MSRAAVASSNEAKSFAAPPVSTPAISSTTYTCNLNALRIFQPEIAKIIDESSVPDSVRCVAARDGSTTFQLQDSSGRDVWFGGSSMPKISAEEMFSTATDCGGNVALPGILTGVEPLILARRLPECRAIFVVESNPLHLKLAMRLHDYVSLLSQGRLVFFLEDDLPRRIPDFFRTYPGFLLPTQIFRVPQRTAAQISELQSRFESLGTVVARVQAEALDAAVARIIRRPAGSMPDSPAVAVVGTDASPASIEFGGRIARGLKKLGRRHSMCLPDAPGKCHIVARVKAIAQADADCVLCVNSRAGPLGPLLPQLPMAAWYSPFAGPLSFDGTDSERDLIAASESQLKFAAGVGAGTRFECIAPSADDTIFRPLPTDERDAGLRTDVAIVANLPVDDPLRNGVSLPSLVSVWQGAQSIIKDNPDARGEIEPAVLLKQAEQRSGIVLEDPKIREQLETWIRERIVPAALARADARALVQSGLAVSVWGDNWFNDEELRAVHRGAIPTTRLNQVFNAAGVVLFPGANEGALQMALDAMCAGACVLMRKDPTDDPPGRSPIASDLSACIQGYQTRRELIDSSKRLLSNSSRRWELTEKARSLVLAGHTVSHRITQIINRLRIHESIRCG